MEEERQTEVLYEIRRHASRSLPFDPSQTQTSGAEAGSGFLSYLSLGGVAKIKEKWSGYYRGRAFKREIFLIVSPNGKYVAVCASNEIVVLEKGNNYMEPCGIYKENDRTVAFATGTWMEAEGILVVLDDLSNIYVIKANGIEVARQSNKQLKIPLPIIGIVVLEDSNSSESLGRFAIFVNDGSIHQLCIRKAHDISATVSIQHISKNVALSESSQQPSFVACVDFNPNLSLVVLLGGSDSSSGNYCLYLLRVARNSELIFCCCGPDFIGSFLPSAPKGQATLDSYPKVQISPQGKYVATLDSVGSLKLFKLESNLNSLSYHSSPKGEYLESIVDMTWWGEGILTLATKPGNVFLYDVIDNKKVSQNDAMVSMPLVEGIKHQPGCVLVLESQRQGENFWSLVSFCEVGISEMYNVLIRSKRYKEALGFCSRYGLDKDEVFKAEWLGSVKDISAIDSCLSKIKDKEFVLSECVNSIGPTEPVLRALISFGLSVTDGYRFGNVDQSESRSLAWNMRIFRLRLLQSRDRLETFLGINMGRFSENEYGQFLSHPLIQTAISLAENGKIGALNLLFKRHPYTISASILNILASIPETIPVHSYSQLLPGVSPFSTSLLREPDWVECEKTVSYIENSLDQSENTENRETEILLKLTKGIIWPAVNNLSDWYMNRAREMDSLSGQLDNCISLMELACQKGIVGLEQFLDQIKYLHDLVYSDEPIDFTMDLATWEPLPQYEKFKLLLKGSKEENVIQKLREKAVPFMLKYMEEEERESYLARWLKELAKENRLSICLTVFENGCGENPIEGLFGGILELVETAVQCVYTCSATDQWSTMGFILSNLLNRITRDRASGDGVVPIDLLEKMERRIKVVQGHVEVGRLLAYYQVPKPMGYFVSGQSEEKNVRQLVRLILSKFGRRQPIKADTEWASMWRDMQCFQEKAFSFLDSEYLLTEFIRGLLKAGKFSLARNYLRGTSSVDLPTEKAESLVINAAREYFFSASTLSCSEIWKAKECLSLLPNNPNVQAESDIIDAITIRLPELGVTLLPMQFKQIKDPMEVIRTIITSRTGAYLNVDEIIDVAKLLGLKTEDEILVVEEAIAREAAVAGDIQLASDLCLSLAKKGHGPAWDLCAAIARGPQLDNLDFDSRKKLLGFALSNCDEASVGELLNAWKEFDICDNLDHLKVSRSSKSREGTIGKDRVEKQKAMLSWVCNEVPNDEKQRKKILSFASNELPWLMELCNKGEYTEKNVPKFPCRRHYFSIKTRAINAIISWLAENCFSPKDELVASLARSVMGPPVSEEDDMLSLLLLLNLVDPLGGVGVIEEEIKNRRDYKEVHSMMGIGLAYSSLNNARKECASPDQRRELLLHGFYEKFVSLDSDGDQMSKAQNIFWTEWKAKLEQEKRFTVQSRALEQLMPGVDAARFLSGDAGYIKSSVFGLVDTVKSEKKHVLKDAVELADTYELHRSEVLFHFLSCALVSDCWENHDILAEISEYRDEIVKNSMTFIHMISSLVYPKIRGQNKQRLSYVFSILSACHARLRRSIDPEYNKYVEEDHHHMHMLDHSRYYKTLEQECLRLSFIDSLDFKNIAGLYDLNFDHFNEEICKNVHENTIDALAETVQSLVGMYDSALGKGLISSEGVYKHYILGQLASLEGRSEARLGKSIEASALQNFLGAIEASFDKCKKYIGVLSQSDISYVIGRYFTLCFRINFSRDPPDDPAWEEVLVSLVNFWIKLVQEIAEKMEVLNCLKTFKVLLTDGAISINQGWDTVSTYMKIGFSSGLTADISYFCKAMVLSGCDFESVGEIFYACREGQNHNVDLLELYGDIGSTSLSDLIKGSNSTLELYRLLSSLSRFSEKYPGDLKTVRSEVWRQLHVFSEKLEIASRTRVFALQLMQAITGENTKTLPPEIVSLVEKWESWDGSGTQNNTGIVPESSLFSSGSITSTLVALKSTQLVSSCLPSFTIAPEDLSTLDSAVSRFLQLSENVSDDLSAESVNVLEAVLEQWEELFCSKLELDKPQDSPKESDEWANDEWGDGWDSLPDDMGSTRKMVTEPESVPVLVHPLHTCWMDVVQKLINLGEINRVMELIDRSLSKSKVLLDEDEANNLLPLLVAKDRYAALKLLLALPHEGPRGQCMQLVETKLRDSTTYDAAHNDNIELLALVLFSGFLRSSTAGPTVYPKMFSYLCYLVGHLARICQEGFVNQLDNVGQKWNERLVFARVLFPCFLSELVMRGEFLLAGFMVSKWMHTHSSLGLIDVVEVSLRRYLEAEVLVQTQNQDVYSYCPLDYIISILRSRLVSLLQSALSAISEK
ncbi:neuroblastoma-amplified sequence protein [Rhynchospora pubera]|uniref:Neuroblastoma-amplified sequence protein n=1 Tax=Rhynchospora pubera TaxID=906938 RepID=A0AAV8E6K5_9POAL|nr:neuroblastoma-amplified sequence protein [Rhynchospora pubera]